MRSLEIKKAESLNDMLNAFMNEPLDGEALSEFYYDNTMAIRTGDEWDLPLDDLFKECTIPKDSNAHLLLGHRGCGKSTELNRLVQEFERTGQPVWVVNSMEELELTEVNHWDIMLLITMGLCGIAEKHGIKLPKKTLDDVFILLNKDVETTETIDDSNSVGLSAGVEAKTPALLSGFFNFFSGIKAEMKASQSTRTTIREKIERRASEWILHINEIADQITGACNGKQPIIIFEDLDKIPIPEMSFTIFRNSVLAQMPFPIIYTFPISQFYSPDFATINSFYDYHVLPMIKVNNAEGNKNDDGFGVIREIVKLRADEGLFKETALTLLIEKTGGSLRDLFVCIVTAARRAVRRGVEKIEDEDAERALSDLKFELTARIEEKHHEMLKKIYCDPLERRKITDRGFLMEMMKAMVVLEYKDEKRWLDVHPLIADFLKDQGVICDANR
jgi:hypothetical protein